MHDVLDTRAPSKPEVWVSNVTIPWGYSKDYSRRNEYELGAGTVLSVVLGEYASVRFHAMRIGEHIAQVTITRKDAVVRGCPHDLVETFAGRCATNMFSGNHMADHHRLTTGQTMAISSMNKKGVSLCFMGIPS